MYKPKAVPSPRALDNERTDREQRDAAAHDDRALIAYQAKWQRKLRRLQQAFPERWRVPGLSDEEVRDRLTLRLIEAVRRPTPVELELGRPGKEWGMLVARLELSALRKSFRLAVGPADLSEIGNWLHAPDQEQCYLEDEAERILARAQAHAEGELSVPQRRWLSAFKLSARAGGIFEASDEPNLSAAARMLGKNRSSAQRSYRELQLRFGRALSSITGSSRTGRRGAGGA
jgi:hypothetical protein